MRLLGVASLLFVAVAMVRSCEPPDCEHEACGGCGNACCQIGYEITSAGMTAEQVNAAIAASLKSGGADGRYTFVGDEDLRQYKIPDGTQFLLQAIHSTKVHRYNDTINIAIAQMEGHVQVRGFSISQIYGAYCDSGQNYKNVMGFIKGVAALKWEDHIIHGCTNKTHHPPPSDVHQRVIGHRLAHTAN